MNTNQTQPNANRYRIFLLIKSVKLIETNIFSEFDYISVLSYNLIKQTSIVLLTSVNLNVWYPKNLIRPVQYHCVKSVQIRSFFCSAFSRIRTEYEEIRSKSPYSVRMRENTNQKNSVFGHFSCSVYLRLNCWINLQAWSPGLKNRFWDWKLKPVTWCSV